MVIINPVPVPPFGGHAYTNITPFTYRDGATYVSVLESLRKYIRDTIVPFIDKNFTGLETYVNDAVAQLVTYVDTAIEDNESWTQEQIDALTSYVNTKVEEIINDSIQVQDPVVAGIFSDEDSESRIVTDAIYASKGLEERVNDIHLNVKDYGAIGDGVTDDTDAIVSALMAHPETNGSFTVYFPEGVYKITRALYLTSPVQLLGAGFAATKLDFSALVSPVNMPYNAAIVAVHRNNIPGQISANPIIIPEGEDRGGAAAYGSISHMEIFGSETLTHNGIFLNNRFTIDTVHVHHFGGDGIVIAANGGYGGVEIKGNANQCKILESRSGNNGKSGLHIAGSDANTFEVMHLVVPYNGEWGIFEGSLLGGLVAACESDGNGIGSYGARVPRSPSRTVWLANYSESTNPIQYDVGPAQMIVGFTGAIPEDSNPVLMTTVGGGWVVPSAYKVALKADQNDMGAATKNPVTGIYRGYIDLRTALNQAILKIAHIAGNYAGITYDGLAILEIPYADVPGNIRKGRAHFSRGFSLSTTVAHEAASAPPTTGAHDRGKILWNTAPAIGQPAGWVCVTSGTPGTWAKFGTLETNV